MENKIIRPQFASTMRLVKGEDLNHHGTLFAGRTAEWFVEAGFIAAAMIVDPKSVVCLKIHGMHFTKPVKPGQVIQFESKIAYAGKSSLVAYIQVRKNDGNEPFVKGFVTFIFVDENTKPIGHGITIEPQTDEEKELYETARNLKK